MKNIEIIIIYSKFLSPTTAFLSIRPVLETVFVSNLNDRNELNRENLSSGFPTRSDKNRAVQPLEMVRGLKFWIYEVEGLYFLCSESKDADAARLPRF